MYKKGITVSNVLLYILRYDAPGDYSFPTFHSLLFCTEVSRVLFSSFSVLYISWFYGNQESSFKITKRELMGNLLSHTLDNGRTNRQHLQIVLYLRLYLTISILFREVFHKQDNFSVDSIEIFTYLRLKYFTSHL